MKINFGQGKGASRFGVAIQHQSIGLIDTDFHHPEALGFQRFDPALGTLRSIHISCESRAMLLGTVTNHSTASERFNVTATVEVSLDTPPGLRPAALLTVPSISAMFSLAPGGLAEIPWNAGIDQKVALLSAPADLALFTGKGRWQVHASTATSHVVMGGGGCIETNVRAKAACDITVQYEFLPARTVQRKTGVFHAAFSVPANRLCP